MCHRFELIIFKNFLAKLNIDMLKASVDGKKYSCGPH